MPDQFLTDQFHLPAGIDYLAVFAWALSGGLVGARKGFDLVGVFLTALVSAIGGGVIRDGVLLQTVPPVLTNAAYLPIVTVATALAIVLARKIHDMRMIERVIEMVDSVGTPAFAVVGVEIAAHSGLPTPGVLMVGCVGGVGGGVLRDMLVREVPEIMQPGRYLAILCALACALYMIMTIGFGLPRFPCAWGVVAGYVLVRWLTLRYDWRTKAVVG
ncbi:MAG: TRIC cation channel family protein [Hyphomicrobiales bacterium]|nr:TRIC cation channel family protein [Hyphomicrobiales bacterium]